MLFYDLNTGKLCQGMQMGLLPEDIQVVPRQWGPGAEAALKEWGKHLKKSTFDPAHFNADITLPYGLTVDHIKTAMEKFIEFLEVTNTALIKNHMAKLEDFMMPANFSSLVGEFMVTSLSKDSGVLVKNSYPNGTPDLLPADLYIDDKIIHGDEGVEIKASKNSSGWCAHNCIKTKLLLFIYNLHPFQFKKVLFADLEKTDWNFSGRSEHSQRTITSSINKFGKAKLESNAVYNIIK